MQHTRLQSLQLRKPITGAAVCWARAVTDEAATAPPTSVMNSRRFMGFALRPMMIAYHANRPTGPVVHYSKLVASTSALGQKGTSEHVRLMSALPLIAQLHEHVRFVP
jgi:hypothetical protein